jgi:hypothetical protein
LSNEVVSPAHYTQAGVECIDVIEAIGKSGESKPYDFFLWASAFQYIWRAFHKGNTLQDLKKGEFYLNRLIKRMEA